MTNKIKIIALTTLMGISSTVLAAGEGWFVGLAAGASKSSYNQQSFTAVTATSVETIGPFDASGNGAGGRLFTGYNFNDWAGSEFGFTAYGSTSYKIPSSYGVVGSTPQIHTNVFDILAKGYLPFFSSGFEMFAKGGMAIVRISQSKSLYTPTSGQVASCQETAGSEPQLCSGSGTPSIYVRPEVMIGASYDFTPKWELEAGYSQIIKGGPVPSISLAYIAISYHWVDIWCGQFLC